MDPLRYNRPSEARRTNASARRYILGLRNFSRKDEAAYKAVNLHEGLDSTLLILQHRLKAKEDHLAIQVIREYGNLPLVACYASQMNQVFLNLLANAIDAIEEINRSRTQSEIDASPGQILIRTRSLDNGCVSIEILDNGGGIPENIKTRVFDPFFTSTEVGKGTGLGLSISYQIVTDSHSGQLACHATLGEMTKFIVTIPVSQDVSNEGREANKREPSYVNLLVM